MDIIEFKKGINFGTAPSVVALGFFDGVHLGHRALIKRARDEAKKRGLLLSVFTFYSECKEIKGSPSRLYSTEAKCELLGSLGVERVYLADFSELSSFSPEEFVNNILIDSLACRVAVSGEDFRFGKGANGNARDLGRLMKDGGGEAITVPDESFRGEKISTTMIKKLLTSCRVSEANELLGAPFFFDARVERGLSLGRKLGIPTVNNSLPDSCRDISRGVYLSRIKIGDNFYTGLTNIGSCPTFRERETHAETFILDFSGEIYGERVRIHLLDFIREEKRFENKDLLLLEIEKNIKEAKEKYEKSDWRI